jgi:hypothetical protein
MELSLSQLKDFSFCPAYYWFNQKSLSVKKDIRLKIITTIIQKCYSRHSETGRYIDWKTILSWINNEIFKVITTDKPESYNLIKSFTESIVTPINKWYFDYYQNHQYDGYINVPISIVSNGIKLIDTIPIIQLSDNPVLIVINDTATTDLDIYNDFYCRGLLYLLSKNLNNDTLILEHYTIGTSRKFEIHKIKSNKKLNDRMEQYIAYLSQSIKAKINYPSFTASCTTCLFKKECIL